jgi:hypothetical protein
MGIEFQPSSSLGGPNTWVLKDGRRLGGIYLPPDKVYRFYRGDPEKLGPAELSDPNLEQLKDKIRARYA